MSACKAVTHGRRLLGVGLAMLLGSSLQAATADQDGYLGSESCAECHRYEYREWQSSHHQQAMDEASDSSVLASFDDQWFEADSRKARFYRRDGQFWIELVEQGQQPEHYQIDYTFGFYPLQQYMVRFEDGRVQLLPYAWDSRTKEQGGQQWFDLYPNFIQPHQDFYWKNAGQNWNYMCADCHSTNLRKNFQADSNSYQTSWSEINVGCEACHGPGKGHMKWLRKQDRSVTNAGFDRSLYAPVSDWKKQAGNPILQPDSIDEDQQTPVCGQCHSRHTQINDAKSVGAGSYGDRYLLSLINDRNYHLDGQVREEAYVYGSYLQSKMQQKGVVCSDCHNPHTGQLKASKEEICFLCHQSDYYNKTQHHGHPEGTKGSLCVNCHMPKTTFMMVDDRADHSWPIPRPDRALKFGTPDICLSCHSDKDSRWSSEQVNSWNPDSKVRERDDFLLAFGSSDRGYPNAPTELTKIAQDLGYPEIIRASALERMQAFPDPKTLIAVSRAGKDPSHMVRLGAVYGAQGLPLQQSWPVLSALTADPVLAVRSEAARALVRHWPELDASQRQQIEPALNDYLEIQNYNGDRGFAHANRAQVLAWQGNSKQALIAYDQAITIEPYFEPSYVNKAELLRALGQTVQELETLQAGAKAQPQGANIQFALGLYQIRAGNRTLAGKYLRSAAELAPENAHFQYVYALSLETQPQQAISHYRRAYQLSGNPRHLYALCEAQLKHKHPEVQSCLDELGQIAPQEIVDQLRRP